MAVAMFLLSSQFSSAQKFKHPSEEEFKIGIAGYTLFSFGTEGALKVLQQLGVHYFSVKDGQLPFQSTTEEMDALFIRAYVHNHTSINCLLHQSNDQPGMKISESLRNGLHGKLSLSFCRSFR